MIGHLQRNKVKRVIPDLEMVHSLDSIRLAETIDNVASQLSQRVPVLLEVNISGDVAKHGFHPDELSERAAEMQQFKNLEVRGLMGMAGLSADDSSIRSQFQCLRALRDSINEATHLEWELSELSMGMSGDFELAIAEGATLVRIGSMLFDGVL